MDAKISKTEFVALMAALMAVDALAMDIMLPAFPAIGAALEVRNPNDRPLILTSFMLGFGPLQLLFGPLTDRFGRRSLILIGLAAYVATSLGAAVAPSFAALLIARFVQGAAAACTKVALLAAIRDGFSGQAMVDIMSLVSAVFLVVPVLCPTIGQGLLFIGSWRLIFVFIALVGAVLGVWATLRLRESLAEKDQRSLDFSAVVEGFRIVIGNRQAFFYGIIGTFMFGIIASMLNTSQQIYVEIFDLGAWFPVAFAFTTVVASISSLFMSKITRRFGMRRVGHAAALIIAGASGAFALLSLAGPPSLPTFYAMLLLVFPCLVATFTTSNALSMEPLGEVAGTASALFGALAMLGGATFGAFVSHLYDGTVTPVLIGNCVMGLCTVVCSLVAERGRLFGIDPAPLDASPIEVA